LQLMTANIGLKFQTLFLAFIQKIHLFCLKKY